MIKTNDECNPRAEKLREHMEAKLSQQDATIAYVAMMADVDIDEEAGGDESNVQED